jgi:hypothetical protein
MNDELKKQIIQKLRIEELDEIQQEAIFSDIGETILRQVVLDVHDIVPAEKHGELKAALEAGDFDSVYGILEGTGIDYNEVMRKSAESVLADISA